jgi:hypothetical protein
MVRYDKSWFSPTMEKLCSQNIVLYRIYVEQESAQYRFSIGGTNFINQNYHLIDDAMARFSVFRLYAIARFSCLPTIRHSPVICSPSIRHSPVLCLPTTRHSLVLCQPTIRHSPVLCSPTIRHSSAVCSLLQIRRSPTFSITSYPWLSAPSITTLPECPFYAPTNML